jgi:hypothetical protein
VKDQGNERSKQKSVEARKRGSVKVWNTKVSRVLAVPKGVYEGFRESDKPLRWGERHDGMTLIDRNQSAAVQ